MSYRIEQQKKGWVILNQRGEVINDIYFKTRLEAAGYLDRIIRLFHNEEATDGKMAEDIRGAG